METGLSWPITISKWAITEHRCSGQGYFKDLFKEKEKSEKWKKCESIMINVEPGRNYIYP